MAGDAMMAVLEGLGFDTGAGIAATGGDEAFYAELVHDFRDDYLQRVAAIRQESDPTMRERLAHDLKAVLRMLGEARLAERAEAWEAALRSQRGGAAEQAAVCDGLARFAEALAPFARP